LVPSVTVHPDGRVEYTFRVELEKTKTSSTTETSSTTVTVEAP